MGSGYVSHCWTSAFDDHFESLLRYPQICERGVVDQRARLLFRGRAQGFTSEPIHIEDEVKDHEDEVEDGRDKMKSAKRGWKRDQTHRRMTHG